MSDSIDFCAHSNTIPPKSPFPTALIGSPIARKFKLDFVPHPTPITSTGLHDFTPVAHAMEKYRAPEITIALSDLEQPRLVYCQASISSILDVCLKFIKSINQQYLFYSLPFFRQ